MGTISKTVQLHMENFRHKQMRLYKLTQLGCVDTSDDFRKRDMKYGTTELNVPAVVKSQTDMTAATPSLTSFGELV
jgi:hypothetical protein